MKSPAQARRKRVITDFEDDGMTQQHFKDDCDINNIIAKYSRGDDISRYQRHVLEVDEDFPTGMTLLEAQQTVRNAEETFMSLPAVDRDYFKNDASRFFDYMHDPKNFKEAAERGYLDFTANPNYKPTQPEAKPATPASQTGDTKGG